MTLEERVELLEQQMADTDFAEQLVNIHFAMDEIKRRLELVSSVLEAQGKAEVDEALGRIEQEMRADDKEVP